MEFGDALNLSPMRFGDAAMKHESQIEDHAMKQNLDGKKVLRP